MDPYVAAMDSRLANNNEEEIVSIKFTFEQTRSRFSSEGAPTERPICFDTDSKTKLACSSKGRLWRELLTSRTDMVMRNGSCTLGSVSCELEKLPANVLLGPDAS
mmetsp:Transcript_107639/g.206977  ORF Transcript_107639/g.206977 Transcript_107639/m.206977 type:complete len:105 (-) Transcript_107639:643-957(-)